MYERLIEKLRDDTMWKNCEFDFIYSYMHEAADAIEELSKMLDEECEINTALICNMPDWIPVTERLPNHPDYDLYLCIVKSERYELTWYELCNYAEGDFITGNALEDEHVTHWMPTPEPPESEVK